MLLMVVIYKRFLSAKEAIETSPKIVHIPMKPPTPAICVLPFPAASMHTIAKATVAMTVTAAMSNRKLIGSTILRADKSRTRRT
jgi:hypothetical protein